MHRTELFVKYRVDSPACAHLCSPIPGIRRSGEPGRVQSLDPLTSGDLCALHGVATRLGAVQFPVTHAAADPRDGPAINRGCKPSGRTDVRAEVRPHRSALILCGCRLRRMAKNTGEVPMSAAVLVLGG